jgi:hypothetical protein
MPDKEPTKPPKPHVSPGAHFFNLRNVNKLPPEERRKVFERILQVIDKELHPPDNDEAAEKKEKPPE